MYFKCLSKQALKALSFLFCNWDGVDCKAGIVEITKPQAM